MEGNTCCIAAILHAGLSSQQACPLQLYILSAGGSLFARSGIEGSGAEHQVPAIRCIEELSWIQSIT